MSLEDGILYPAMRQARIPFTLYMDERDYADIVKWASGEVMTDTAKLSDVDPKYEGTAFANLEVEENSGGWERKGGAFVLRFCKGWDSLVVVSRGDTEIGRFADLFLALDAVRRRSPTGYVTMAAWPRLENKTPLGTPFGEFEPWMPAYGRCWTGNVGDVHLRLHEVRGGWAIEADNLVKGRRVTVARPSLMAVYELFRVELEECLKSGNRAGDLLGVMEREGVDPVEGDPWWERLS